jgi:hypothetical protein
MRPGAFSLTFSWCFEGTATLEVLALEVEAPVAIALDDDEWDPGGDDLVYVFPLNADASTLSAGDRIELDGEVTLDCTGDEITGVGVAIRMNDDEIRSGEGEPGDPAEIYVSAKRVDGSQSVDGPELDIECAP